MENKKIKILKESFNKRRNLLMVSVLGIVLLGVATYAWFIGMQIVSVTSFDVQIASTDSLLLSFDGVKWDTTLHINKDIVDDVSYPGHKNSWGTGLRPISTVGQVDIASSRIIAYEKTSLTATKGGYRIMANKVPTNTPDEYPGYVVFDLFIKNFSGDDYIKDYSYLNEEAIFFDYSSKVETSVNGGTPGTGIENSVRVAFVPIGRVPAKVTDQSIITGITCGATPGAQKVHGVGENAIVEVGICERTQIWEPNDTSHVQNAINYYNESCRKRTGGVNSLTYSSDNCLAIENDKHYQTYPIKSEVLNSYYVDVYDGIYNGYEGNSAYLDDFDYFLDSTNIAFNEENQFVRPEFMRLAPNSITKVKVYVYIEGQDIDNYDYAALGSKISVSFGFTKERFEERDLDYHGPSTQQPAVILPANASPYTTTVGSVFDPMSIGVVATYAKLMDGTETYFDPEIHVVDEYASVTNDDIISVTENTVDTSTAGSYYVRYRAVDDRGNIASTTMTVVVE